MDSQIAERELRRMRSLLDAPSPREAWWDGLNKAERSTLLRHAGVDPELHPIGWCRFTYTQRRRIVEAARRAARWATELEGKVVAAGLRDCDGSAGR